MDITKKSIGMLIDELSITNLKCYECQEVVCNESDNNLAAGAARRAQSLNARRNQLIIAIDNLLDPDSFSPTEKSYD